MRMGRCCSRCGRTRCNRVIRTLEIAGCGCGCCCRRSRGRCRTASLTLLLVRCGRRMIGCVMMVAMIGCIQTRGRVKSRNMLLMVVMVVVVGWCHVVARLVLVGVRSLALIVIERCLVLMGVIVRVVTVLRCCC